MNAMEVALKASGISKKHHLLLLLAFGQTMDLLLKAHGFDFEIIRKFADNKV